MNIIIEGCDGTGKSTLARYFESLGMFYWHESEPRSFEEYCKMLSTDNVVFDRFCFGQFVYNLPEQRKMTEEELHLLATEIAPKTNTLIIYVNCPTQVIIDRLIERGEGAEELRMDMEKYVKNIRGTYRSVLTQSGAKYIEINGEDQNYGNNI